MFLLFRYFFSSSTRPNTLFGLRTQLAGSRLFEGPDVGDAAWTRQSESFQSFNMNSGLVLHRVPDADISAMYISCSLSSLLF